MAAKKTAELIPLCHPLALDSVGLDFAFEEDGVRATATASLTGRTGVEMEAMTATAIALLTIYDMAKAIGQRHGHRRGTADREARRQIGKHGWVAP